MGSHFKKVFIVGQTTASRQNESTSESVWNSITIKTAVDCTYCRTFRVIIITDCRNDFKHEI